VRPTPGPGGAGTLLEVKVVPGASRSRVAGPFGDGVRVQVAAPPERGRANEELCATLAAALGVRPSDVSVVRGASGPRKVVHVATLGPDEVARRLAS
jgi:uncharacterized protein (TIGR00251 family)